MKSDAQRRAEKKYRNKTTPIILHFNLSNLYLLQWTKAEAKKQNITTQAFIRRIIEEAYNQEK